MKNKINSIGIGNIGRVFGLMALLAVTTVSSAFAESITKTFEFGAATANSTSNKRTFNVPRGAGVSAAVEHYRLGDVGAKFDVPIVIELKKPGATADVDGALAISITVDKERISGGETLTAKINRSGDTASQLAVRLESTQPSLVVVPKDDVVLRPGESSVPFILLSVATPIKTTVTIKAFLPGVILPRAIRGIEIVPAMLKGVTLSQPTLNGTSGSKINCRVELNANAPTGGIEIYLGPLVDAAGTANKLSLGIPNPRVQAGSKLVEFGIEYDDILRNGEPIRDDYLFNEARTLRLLVALEPQQLLTAQAVPGVANKIEFQVIPLRVVSISVQPTSVTGGGEALATFTLNFPAGNGEKVGILRDTTTRKAWGQALGSSCPATFDSTVISTMPLTQGVATHSFKVCTANVSTSTTETLRVVMRTPGNTLSVQITVQP